MTFAPPGQVGHGTRAVSVAILPWVIVVVLCPENDAVELYTENEALFGLDARWLVVKPVPVGPD